MYSLPKKSSSTRRDVVTRKKCLKNKQKVEPDSSYESSSLWEHYHSIGGTSVELSSMEYSQSIMERSLNTTTERKVCLQHTTVNENTKMLINDGNKENRLPTISSTDCSISTDAEELCYPLSSTMRSLDGKDYSDSSLHISAISSIGSGATADMSSRYYSTSLLNSRQSECISQISLFSGSSYSSCHLNSRQFHIDLSLSNELTYDCSDSEDASMNVLCGSSSQKYRDPYPKDAPTSPKTHLGERPACIGAEDKISSHDSSHRYETSSRHSLRSIRRSFKQVDNSNNSVYSGTCQRLPNTTVDSDSSMFMVKPMCCIGVVGNKPMSKDRKKSIGHKLKKIVRQMKGLSNMDMKNSELTTLAIL